MWPATLWRDKLRVVPEVQEVAKWRKSCYNFKPLMQAHDWAFVAWLATLATLFGSLPWPPLAFLKALSLQNCVRLPNRHKLQNRWLWSKLTKQSWDWDGSLLQMMVAHLWRSTSLRWLMETVPQIVWWKSLEEKKLKASLMDCRATSVTSCVFAPRAVQAFLGVQSF